MKSVIPLLGLFVMLGCDGAATPEAPDTLATVEEGLTVTGPVFGAAPVTALDKASAALSAREGQTFGVEHADGQVLRGVLDPAALRAFQANRAKTWGGEK